MMINDAIGLNQITDGKFGFEAGIKNDREQLRNRCSAK